MLRVIWLLWLLSTAGVKAGAGTQVCSLSRNPDWSGHVGAQQGGGSSGALEVEGPADSPGRAGPDVWLERRRVCPNGFEIRELGNWEVELPASAVGIALLWEVHGGKRWVVCA